MNRNPSTIRHLIPEISGKWIAYFLAVSVMFVAATTSDSISDTVKTEDEFHTHYVQARKLLDCRLFLPDDFDPSKKYPLVIGLHGYGGGPDGFSGIRSYFTDKDLIFAVPEAPYAYTRNGVKSGNKFSWDFKVNDRELWEKSDPWVREYILQIAVDLRKEYKVSSTIILGFSQGVAYTYSAAFHSGGLIDGVICFAGNFPDADLYPWLLDEKIIRSGLGIKIFIAHGTTDLMISSTKSVEAAEKLRGYGYKVELLLFEGAHTIPQSALLKAFEFFEID